jgi:mRNA interferase MazF
MGEHQSVKTIGPKLLFPRRGEIWQVNLEPAIGDEMKKTRPAVVISSDEVGALNLKLAVPLTGWNPKFARSPWLVRIKPDRLNNLDKEDAADTLQTRCLSIERFVKRIGRVSDPALREILAALAIVTDMDSDPVSQPVPDNTAQTTRENLTNDKKEP